MYLCMCMYTPYAQLSLFNVVHHFCVSSEPVLGVSSFSVTAVGCAAGSAEVRMDPAGHGGRDAALLYGWIVWYEN